MNTAPTCLEPLAGPSVWTAADFAADSSWLYTLTPAQIDCLRAAAAHCAHADFAQMTEARMRTLLAPLLPLAETLRQALGGRGFALLRGVPVDELERETAGRLFWALGALLGTGLTQNAAGDLLCPVTDRGVAFGYTEDAQRSNARGYQSRADLNYHCDPTDVVGLLCVRKAKAGGASTIVSTPAIYNEFVRHHPQHLPVLLHGFPYDRKGEQWPGEAPVTERIPVFVRHADRVSCRYARSYIQGGAAKLGHVLTTDERAALDCFDAIARRPEMALQMAFEPGDVQLLNNLTVLHGRTAYEDDADPAHRRFLYRLWLHMGEAAPWQAEDGAMRWAFARFGNLGRTAGEWARLRAGETPQ